VEGAGRSRRGGMREKKKKWKKMGEKNGVV